MLDGGSLGVPGTAAAAAVLATLAREFRAAGWPVVHVVRLYQPDGSNAEPFRRALVTGPVPVLAPGTPGAELAPCLAPPGGPSLDAELLLAGGVQALGPSEVVMAKPRWGAFYCTPLDEHLRGLGVRALVVGGANFTNCPRATVVEASERDYEVTVVRDGTSGLDQRGCAELAALGVAVAEAAALGSLAPSP